jgi:hypothetical protein
MQWRQGAQHTGITTDTQQQQQKTTETNANHATQRIRFPSDDKEGKHQPQEHNAEQPDVDANLTSSSNAHSTKRAPEHIHTCMYGQKDSET